MVVNHFFFIFAFRTENIQTPNHSTMRKQLTLFAFALVALTTNAQSCPDNNHPHMIDLGLPSGTKWACCNVGADKPETNGGYYAWGETEEKEVYSWSTYIHCDGSFSTCHDLGSNISGTEYDVAHVKWGGEWQMPTINQIKELINNCDYEQITINKVKVGKFTGVNDNSIILPLSGYHYADHINSLGKYGSYWAGNMARNYSYSAYTLMIDLLGGFWEDYSNNCVTRRSDGLPVRPVVGKDAPEYEDLVLNTHSLNLIEGEQTEIEISSGNGQYSAESMNTDMVTAVIMGQSIVQAKALKAGTTSIVVKDMCSNQKWVISVTVAERVETLSCPDGNHPHVIDLALPSGTKWACCNVGARAPENNGGYFAWGETIEKDEYTPVTYSHCHETDDTNCHSFWDKYYKYDDLGNEISGTEYDVANVKWGNCWVMPLITQVYELMTKCQHKWVGYDGVKGVLFTGSNGMSIFLPAAGSKYYDLSDEGVEGCYWTGTASHDDYSRPLEFAYGNVSTSSSFFRHYGYTVRPVISGTNGINHPKPLFDVLNPAVYNVYGIKVADNADNMNILPPGIYIANGKKYVVK